MQPPNRSRPLSLHRLLSFAVSLALLGVPLFVFLYFSVVLSSHFFLFCLSFSLSFIFFLSPFPSFSLSSPRYLHLDNSNVFQWRSEVRLVERFARGRALCFTLARAALSVWTALPGSADSHCKPTAVTRQLSPGSLGLPDRSSHVDSALSLSLSLSLPLSSSAERWKRHGCLL